MNPNSQIKTRFYVLFIAIIATLFIADAVWLVATQKRASVALQAQLESTILKQERELVRSYELEHTVPTFDSATAAISFDKVACFSLANVDGHILYQRGNHHISDCHDQVTLLGANGMPVLVASFSAKPATFLSILSQHRYEALFSFLVKLAMFVVFFVVVQAIDRKRMETLVEQERIKGERERDQRLSHLALQVAHDIRSPISALSNILAPLRRGLDDEREALLDRVFERMNDTASRLLRDYGSRAITADDSVVFQLNPVLEHLVEEKRAEYGSVRVAYSNLNLNDDDELFLNVPIVDFKSVISNLIKNAVESINHENGHVLVHIESEPGVVAIEVQDNGQGIPDRILPKVFDKHYSYGKSKGTGLGLYNALKRIEDWGGSIDLHSEINLGTVVHITLPRATVPKWYLPKLDLAGISKVVVLSPSTPVHKLWEQKLRRYHDIAIEHVFDMRAFEKSLAGRKIQHDVFYLIDGHFDGMGLDGISLIDRIGLKHQAVLMADVVENAALMRRCDDLGIKVASLNALRNIDISVQDRQPKRIVLIDDDELSRKSWQMFGQSMQTDVHGFASLKEFIEQIQQYDTDTLVFVDVDLGHGMRGEQAAKILSEKHGFNRIYLTTGFDQSSLAPSPHITGVIDKTFPRDLVETFA